VVCVDSRYAYSVDAIAKAARPCKLRSACTAAKCGKNDSSRDGRYGTAQNAPEQCCQRGHVTVPITGRTKRLPTPTETHIALPLPLNDRRVTNGSGGGGAHVRTATTDYRKF